MTTKWEASCKKRGFWGYLGPGLQSAEAAYSRRTADKKVPLLLQYRRIAETAVQGVEGIDAYVISPLRRKNSSYA